MSNRTHSFTPMLALAALVFGPACRTLNSAPAPARENAPEPVSANIEMRGGKPTILINGVATTPMMYAITDVPGGRWSWEEIPAWNIRTFGRAGYRIVQFSIWLEDIWSADDRLDMELVRQQMRGVLTANPGAVLFLRLHINAPKWWNLAHPEETVRYADIEGHLQQPAWGLERNTTDRDDLEGGHLHSLASQRWQDDTSRVLTRFFQALARTSEGNALAFVNLCTGVSHEWHNWGFLQHEPDTSAPMTGYFRNWLRRRYVDEQALRMAWNDPRARFDDARIPDLAQRRKTFDGVFRDPTRERPVIDYYEAQHDVVADDIIHFDGLVKRTWPRPLLVGNFFGYHFMTFSRQAAGGHLAVGRVLRAPEVDFLAAPQSYFGPAHGMGGSGQSRALVESARLHGKLVLDEMDQFTAMKHPFDNPAEDKIADDIALIRRNTAHPLSRGAGMWFFDFGPNFQTGWWAHPRYIEEVRALKSLFDDRLSRPLDRRADVLVVWDMAGYRHVANGWTPVSESGLDGVSNALHHSGVLFDDVFVDDVPLLDLSPYRVVVYANTWHLDEQQRKVLRERVARDGRHVLHVYLSGYTNGHRNDVELASQAIGIHLQRLAPRSRAEIAVDANKLPALRYGLAEYQTPLSPIAAVHDPDAEILGVFTGSSHTAFARKRRADGGFTWHSALPIRESGLWRAIFAQAGAHVFSDAGDAIGGGNGIFWIHTVAGGSRRIDLGHGRVVDLQLAPRSTTLLERETGAVLR